MKNKIEFSTLPIPLSADEEAAIISKLGGDPSLKSTLIAHNLYIILNAVKKFDDSGVSIDDLISLGTIGLLKAINSLPLKSNINLSDYIVQMINKEFTDYIK